MAASIAQRIRRLLGRPREEHPVSLDDFVVTVDTKASGGDKIVLRLARRGEKTLCMQAHMTQFMWLIDDPEEFARAYQHRAHWVDPYAVQEASSIAVGA